MIGDMGEPHFHDVPGPQGHIQPFTETQGPVPSRHPCVCLPSTSSPFALPDGS